MISQGTIYDIRNTIYAIREASVAELADAQGLGPCVLLDVEVRVLSLAVFNRINLEKKFNEAQQTRSGCLRIGYSVA